MNCVMSLAKAAVDLRLCNMNLTALADKCQYYQQTHSLYNCTKKKLYDMQDAVDKLFADVAHLAAAGSSFLFDFLHLDALQGLSHPVGFANTAKVLCMPVGQMSCWSNVLSYHSAPTFMRPSARVLASSITTPPS